MIYERCVNAVDLHAGSPEERAFLEHVVGLLDNPRLWIQLVPVPVMYWRDKGTRIEARGVAMPALAMPYSPGGRARGRLTLSLSNAEGNVYLSPFPRDLDDAKYVVLEAQARGAAAVVFYGKPRRIVVTGRPDYSDSPAPVGIPVASAGPQVLDLVGDVVELVSEVERREATGYSLMALNSLDEPLLISAHLDHWLHGAADNCAGVEAAVKAFLNLVGQYDDAPVGLLLTTAEEGTGPHIPSLYWAWGARAIFRGWKFSPRALVNMDVVGHGREKAYGMPYLARAVADLNAPIPYFDSLYLETAGMPSLTISGIDGIWDVYHSQDDSVVDMAAVDSAAVSAMRIAAGLLREVPIPDVEKRLESLGVPMSDPSREERYRAWSLIYNYVVTYGGTAEYAEIKYVDIPAYLEWLGRCTGLCPHRVEALDGPTLYEGGHYNAAALYRDRVYYELRR